MLSLLKHPSLSFSSSIMDSGLPDILVALKTRSFQYVPFFFYWYMYYFYTERNWTSQEAASHMPNTNMFLHQPKDSPEKDQTNRVATKRLLKRRSQIENKDKWSMNICDREEEPPNGNRAAVEAWPWCRKSHISAASRRMRDKPRSRQCSDVSECDMWGPGPQPPRSVTWGRGALSLAQGSVDCREWSWYKARASSSPRGGVHN